MPILGKRYKHRIYYEIWENNITTEDVVYSATERKKWATEDGCVEQYYIILDGKNCRNLPPVSGLISAAQIHPADAVEMVGINVATFPRIIARMFGQFAAQPVTICDTKEDALAYIEKRIQDKTAKATFGH